MYKPSSGGVSQGHKRIGIDNEVVTLCHHNTNRGALPLVLRVGHSDPHPGHACMPATSLLSADMDDWQQPKIFMTDLSGTVSNDQSSAINTPEIAC